MAIARVVSFDGVDSDRIAELRARDRGRRAAGGDAGQRAPRAPRSDAEQALAIVLFDNEDDYRKGDEILDAMPASDTPGQRSSVTKYDVALRMTP